MGTRFAGQRFSPRFWGQKFSPRNSAQDWLGCGAEIQYKIVNLEGGKEIQSCKFGERERGGGDASSFDLTDYSFGTYFIDPPKDKWISRPR